MILTCVCCGSFSKLDRYHRCRICAPTDDYLLLEVRDFVRQNGNVSIGDMCDEFSIDESRIQRWVAEDRLGYQRPVYTCEHCGEDVVVGFLCSCQENLLKQSHSNGPPRSLQKRRDDYWDNFSRIRKHQRRELLMIKR